MSAARVRVCPLLIDGGLFAVDYQPLLPDPSQSPPYLLLLPPFGEEMNRCRPMVAQQARALAALGVGTLVLDLSGTGDSAGELGAVTWDDWCADAASALGWLGHAGRCCIGLWGIRLGALLALDVAAANAGADWRLLLWQPVIDGKLFLTQFLRLRLATAMMQNGTKETTAGLRQQLRDGAPLEIGGYRLNPALAEAIEQRRMADRRVPLRRIDWFELSGKLAEPATEPQLTPASTRAIEQWRAELPATSIQAQAVPGEAFWSLYERTLAPALIAATTAQFR